jgi:hypothetical protein
MTFHSYYCNKIDGYQICCHDFSRHLTSRNNKAHSLQGFVRSMTYRMCHRLPKIRLECVTDCQKFIIVYINDIKLCHVSRATI